MVLMFYFFWCSNVGQGFVRVGLLVEVVIEEIGQFVQCQLEYGIGCCCGVDEGLCQLFWCYVVVYFWLWSVDEMWYYQQQYVGQFLQLVMGEDEQVQVGCCYGGSYYLLELLCLQWCGQGIGDFWW